MSKQMNWKVKARAEGRVCPECNQPVSQDNWKDMQTKKGVRSCLSCRYAHWQIPVGCRGDVMRDNSDRDTFIQELES